MSGRKKAWIIAVPAAVTVFSCAHFSPAATEVVPSGVPVRTVSPAQKISQTSALPTGRTPTATFPVDRTRTPTRTEEPTATYPPIEPGPFRYAAPLAEPFPSPLEEVQVRAPADGSVWVITSRTASRWDGQAWNVVRAMEEGLLADVDDAGRLWVFRQEGEAIDVWQDGAWSSYGAETGWAPARAAAGSGWWTSQPWRVSPTADGAVWLPTESDVRRFDGERWKIFTLEDMGFPGAEEEGEGVFHPIALVNGGKQVWVGECAFSGPGPVSNPGVRWYDGLVWRGADSPVGENCVTTVDVDPKGNVWIGAENGVWRYEPGRRQWTAFPLPEELLEGYNFTYTRELAVDGSGDVWAYLQYCGGASCAGSTVLLRIHAGQWSKVFENQEWFASFQRLAVGGGGQGWLFWGGTVYRLAGEDLVAEARLPARGVIAGADGTIWAAAGHESDAALWVLEP